ncbi:DUF6894 family protein, partial [Bradyrhizobium sp. CCBAU 65884]|uniref:DUF6894 family protein n=1 Tax=Bradyrhizobium sp. CCBAU 65884 TaxID=722477 RepID=UPI002306A996
FHLNGSTPAHNMFGQELADDNAAKEHASFIAHRLGTANPAAVRQEKFISVRDEWENELFQEPLVSTTV